MKKFYGSVLGHRISFICTFAEWCVLFWAVVQGTKANKHRATIINPRKGAGRPPLRNPL